MSLTIILTLLFGTLAEANSELVCGHECIPSPSGKVCNTSIIKHTTDEGKIYLTKTDDIMLAKGQLPDGTLYKTFWRVLEDSEKLLHLVENRTLDGIAIVQVLTFSRKSQHFTYGAMGVVDAYGLSPTPQHFQVAGGCIEINK